MTNSEPVLISFTPKNTKGKTYCSVTIDTTRVNVKVNDFYLYLPCYKILTENSEDADSREDDNMTLKDTYYTLWPTPSTTRGMFFQNHAFRKSTHAYKLP